MERKQAQIVEQSETAPNSRWQLATWLLACVGLLPDLVTREVLLEQGLGLHEAKGLAFLFASMFALGLIWLLKIPHLVRIFSNPFISFAFLLAAMGLNVGFAGVFLSLELVLWPTDNHGYLANGLAFLVTSTLNIGTLSYLIEKIDSESGKLSIEEEESLRT